jgi:hypothetical protein
MVAPVTPTVEYHMLRSQASAARRAILPAMLLVMLSAVACRRPQPVVAPAESSAPTVDELRRDLTVFASDSFAGRATGTLGAERAARFLVQRLTTLGIEPAGDSGYLQRVPLSRARYGAASRFEIVTPEGRRTLALGQDLVPLPVLGRDAPLPRLRADGDLVYYGYVSGAGAEPRGAPAADLAGKVLVVVNGAPPGVDGAERDALEAESRIGPRLRELIPLRPAAIIVLTAGRSAKFVDQIARQLAPGGDEGGDGGLQIGAADSLRTLPMILLGTAKAGSPLLPDGWPASDARGPLAGKRFAAQVDIAFHAYNVVAVVRGRDPVLHGSYVAYGAHYDHIGILKGAGSDSIANGADDDGTGSVTLLALARLFEHDPPRRSVLFVWHVAEEEGLLGSDWFTSHPAVPIDSIVAQVNADMIGRNHPDSLYIVGPNAAPNGQSRVLGAVIDSVNQARERPFAVNREWDSPTHPEQIYYRSDHYNYARRGVPVVFLTTGLHADYHAVGDEVSKIDFDKFARVAALMYDSGRALANRPTRPK